MGIQARVKADNKGLSRNLIAGVFRGKVWKCIQKSIWGSRFNLLPLECNGESKFLSVYHHFDIVSPFIFMSHVIMTLQHFRMWSEVFPATHHLEANIRELRQRPLIQPLQHDARYALTVSARWWARSESNQLKTASKLLITPFKKVLDGFLGVVESFQAGCKQSYGVSRMESICQVVMKTPKNPFESCYRSQVTLGSTS